jgi:hypothetical protein
MQFSIFLKVVSKYLNLAILSDGTGRITATYIHCEIAFAWRDCDVQPLYLCHVFQSSGHAAVYITLSHWNRLYCYIWGSHSGTKGSSPLGCYTVSTGKEIADVLNDGAAATSVSASAFHHSTSDCPRPFQTDRSWMWRHCGFSKRRQLFTVLHSVTSLKI